MRFKSRSVLIALVAVFAMSAVATSSALAAGKPVVKTGAATNVTNLAASLHGTVNPTGLETTYDFEYGTTESYGSKTSELYAGNGTTALEESASVTGLKPNTKYDFRIVARNSAGTAFGLNASFTTKAPEFSERSIGATFMSAGSEYKLHWAGLEYGCKNQTLDGKVTGKYTVGEGAMKFTGCTVTKGEHANGCSLNSSGLAAGEVVTRALKGQLGIVPTSEQANATGLLLEPETGSVWTTLAEDACSPELAVEGSLALGVEPIEKLSLTGEFTAALFPNLNILEFTPASGKTVKPRLISFGENFTVAGTDAVTYSKETEVK